MARLTVSKWTLVQNHLPDDFEGRRLWHWIEHRTNGKSWSKEVNIGLPTKAYRDMVNEALNATESADAEKAVGS